MLPNGSDKGEVFGIQMLRGIAALAVVTHHTLEQSNGATHPFSPDWLTTSGASGVDIFFVISGFIMLYVSFPVDKAPLTPSRFLLRRVTRIYPFYWLCCLAMIVIFAAGFLKHDHLSHYDQVASLLLLPSAGKYLAVSWTLVYEIYFYVVFALILVAGSRAISTVGTSCLIAVGLLLGGATGDYGAFFANPIPLEFCMGLFLAWGFARWQPRELGAALPVVAGCLGFALLAAAPLLVKHASTAGLDGSARLWAWGVPAVLVVVGFLQVGAPRNGFAVSGAAGGRVLRALSDAPVCHGWVCDSDACDRVTDSRSGFYCTVGCGGGGYRRHCRTFSCGAAFDAGDPSGDEAEQVRLRGLYSPMLPHFPLDLECARTRRHRACGWDGWHENRGSGETDGAYGAYHPLL